MATKISAVIEPVSERWMLTVSGSGTPFTVEHLFDTPAEAEAWVARFATTCHLPYTVTIK